MPFQHEMQDFIYFCRKSGVEYKKRKTMTGFTVTFKDHVGNIGVFRFDKDGLVVVNGYLGTERS